MTDNVNTDLYNFVSSYVDSSNVGLINRVIPATVTEIDRSRGFVVVDAAIKSEGVIPLEEFFLAGEKDRLQVGDVVDVYVLYGEKEGKVILSREKAIREKSLAHLEKCFENKETCFGIVFGKVKGGLIVDFDGAEAFLPGSQIVEDSTIRDVSQFMGQRIECMVLKIQKDGPFRTTIVSRRAVLEERNKKSTDSFLENIHEGLVMEGVVKNITDYGVFVRLYPGIDGLVYLSDICWEKITHPMEVLEQNQTVKVVVLGIDKDKRISLGMKQLIDNPWNDLKQKYANGGVVKCKVTDVRDRDAIVEIEDGVHAVIPENEFAWGLVSSSAKFKSVNVGDVFDAKIITVDTNNQKIIASCKHLEESPEEKYLDSIKEGTTVKGKILMISEYGIFVELAPKVEGKISNYDICWDGNIAKVTENLKIGDEIEVMYLGRKSVYKDIALGLKQLTKSPFDEKLANVNVGDVVTVVVTDNSNKKFLETSLFDSIKVTIDSDELSKDPSEQKTNRFAIGNKLDAIVTNIDRKHHKISVSVKEFENKKYMETVQKYGSSNSGATIASVFKSFQQDNDENDK